MMKRFPGLLTLLALAVFASPAMADRLNPARDRLSSEDANNSIFVEAGGPGLLYSVNYERVVENDFGLRIGLSYVSFSATASGGGSTSTASAGILAVPVIASYLGLRGGNHILELGAGGTAVYATGAASGSGLSVMKRLAGEVGKMPRELWPVVAQHWSNPKSLFGFWRDLVRMKTILAAGQI